MDPYLAGIVASLYWSNNFLYTSFGKIGVSVYGKLGMSSVLDLKTCRVVMSTSVLGGNMSNTSLLAKSWGSNGLISIHAFFQAMGFLNPLVWISAAILAVISKNNTK